eukprot:TRINITY_DN7119_c0_g1_i7.p1 TRINITY_DN7119_c0_g1~~TRINITY_DN7119_c0_g1_i7.p1  ORF type:complete len:781 (-),score=283.39 TRINITY_DN7119_c0_g1_i7:51-2393(-)
MSALEEKNHDSEAELEDDVPLSKNKKKVEIVMTKEDDDDEDDTPLSKRKPALETKKEEEDDSDDDVPLAARKKTLQAKQDSDDEDEDSEEEESEEESEEENEEEERPKKRRKPTPKKKPTKAKKPAKRKSKKQDDDEDEEDEEDEMEDEDDDDEDGGKKSKKKSAKSSKKSGGGKNVELITDYVMADDVVPLVPEKGAQKWWDMPPLQGDQMWQTLKHNGVIFPPPYEPHGVKMKYDGREIELTPEQEEVATWYAAKLESPHVAKPKFNENFFNDWKKLLGKNHPIREFKKCDFSPIFNWLNEQKELKKAMRQDPAYKERMKREKADLDSKYGFALVDGGLEKIQSYRVEPPSLFLGRGDHPKTGMIKARIRPEDVTINIGFGEKAPKAPEGHRWKGVIHDNTVTWLAFWKDNINDHYKYVWLSSSSRFKGQSDIDKFGTARELKKHIDRIRSNYMKELTSDDMKTRQRATALWVIDRLALRVGNEKDTKEEADTVGCCSLRVEHVKLIEGTNEILFNFLGKDSMPYVNQVQVDPKVFANFKKFVGRKEPSSKIFDTFGPADLNKYLNSLMPGLTAKVFRTYNASITLQKELGREDNKIEEDATVDQKIHFYNLANKEVAILCNHQRTVPKNYDNQVQNLDAKVQEIKDKQDWLRLQLGEKKRKKPSDDDDDEEGGPKTKSAKELQKIAEEKNWKAPADKTSLQNQIAKLDERLATAQIRKQLKTDTKTVALGTSKINYMDPRITVAWCKRTETPIEKIFNKALLNKFPWAMEVPDDWEF